MKKLSTRLSHRKKKGHFSQRSTFVLGRLEVFQWGKRKFSCGSCLSIFSSREEATRCLYSCAIKSLSESGVVMQRSTDESLHYFCGICQRKYINEIDAKFCFQNCLESVLRSFPHDIALRVKNRRQRVKDYAELLKKNRDRVLNARKRNLIQMTESSKLDSCILQESLLEEEAREKAEAPESEVYVQPLLKVGIEEEAPAKVEENIIELPIPGVPTEAPPAEEAGGEPDPDLLYREEDQKPFFRQDAKYVCSVCQSKFFTKQEVEECFFSHPLRPK